MNEPKLPIGPVRPTTVRTTSWVGFLATTIALMLLASGGTAYLVNISTGSGAVPKNAPLSIAAGPTALPSATPVVVSGLVGAIKPPAQTVTVSQPSALAPAVQPTAPVVKVPVTVAPPTPPAPEPTAPVIVPIQPEPLPTPTKPNGKPIKNLTKGLLDLVGLGGEKTSAPVALLRKS